LAFAHALLLSPSEFESDSVNGLAQQVLDFFLSQLSNTRIESEWPCLWLAPAEPVGLGRRASSVEQAFAEHLRKRMSRVAKLAAADTPRQAGPVRGLFVRFVDFGRVFVSVEAVFSGQRRMADTPLAPSRSYLKVEEAYGILGCEPEPGEAVADLGAAPGGWSYSAARRGARVIAVDNGPLKGGALGHPMIRHVLEDAFGFRPENDEPFDWLFCDLVDEPHHVLSDLVTPWLERRWCLKFIVNLKFGRVDPIVLLGELRSPSAALSLRAHSVRIRHLFHDREEFTVVGISN
jgi:23S rRNA (cytidine2498-2'-O)-methyltransferase